MKVKVLLIAVAVLALTAVSFGQGFLESWNTMVVLTDQCGGGAPLPDGTPVYVYWDANSNGPDASDILAPVCNNPPNCEDGPVGSVNYNQFPMNGVYWNGIEGTFGTEVYMVSAGNIPNPSRFYLVVMGQHAMYTSPVYTFAPGAVGDVDVTDWTCAAVTPSCTPSADVMFDPPAHSPGPVDQFACVTLCNDGHIVLINVGPLAGPDRVPHYTITPGCELCGNPSCTAAGAWDISQPMWVEMNGMWYYQTSIALAAGAAEGCVCVHFDAILAASIDNSSIAIVPMDRSNRVSFATASETGISRFEVKRDGRTVKTFDASNSPTGNAYSFVDADLANGTTYNYTLDIVNLDNTRSSMVLGSATPNFDAAVVTEYALHQNFPNPFNPTTKIAFDLVENNTVSLTVFNAAGQEVTTLMSNRSMTKGRHSVSFDATNLPSGLYFYTIKIGSEFSATKKMLLVK